MSPGCGERLVFFDLETAGLREDSSIIQIAAIAVTADLSELETFEAKLRFDVDEATTEALSFNSFEPTIWKRLAREPKDAAYRFSDFLRQHATVDLISAAGKPYQVAQLVAHNAPFDGPKLKRLYDTNQIFLPAHRRVYCTLQRAYWLFAEQRDLSPPTSYKLATLCEYFGIRLPDDQAHDALADVRATVALYRAMMLETRVSARNAA